MELKCDNCLLFFWVCVQRVLMRIKGSKKAGGLVHYSHLLADYSREESDSRVC